MNKMLIMNSHILRHDLVDRLLNKYSYVNSNNFLRASVPHYVPLQDFTRPWTDADLYAKYGLTDEEIQFIESMIKPME